MNVIIGKSAIKDFKKINEPYKSTIKEKIKTLQNFPDTQQIKQLKNHDPKYRLRVGDYRILFNVSDGEITVARIRHRKESYYS
jgi:mRNA interferase RelE/StbE